MWGTAGILYNRAYVPDSDAFSWECLWDKKYAGKILMKDSYRDAYGTAVIYAHAKELEEGTVQGCFRMGLYWQGLIHDLSKYSLTEFKTGVEYYQGNKSPNAAEREDKGYSEAWLHHKGRNRHHYEYWTDVTKDRSLGIVGIKMPVKYVAEMFADRVAACKTYEKDRYTTMSP